MEKAGFPSVPLPYSPQLTTSLVGVCLRSVSYVLLANPVTQTSRALLALPSYHRAVELTLEQLIGRLAEVSDRTWMRQKAEELHQRAEDLPARHVGGERPVIESAPIWPSDGPGRGVVGERAVGKSAELAVRSGG